MPSRLIPIVLSALALLPASAQPVPDVAVLTHHVALEPSNASLDVPIEDIVASAGGCAVLDKDFPRLREHAMYGFFKSMSLHQIAAMSHGKITPDMLVQARSDLSALSFMPAAKSDQPVDFEDPAPPVPPGNQASLSHNAPKK